MSLKQSKGLNKLLNFIGLVDDDRAVENNASAYNSANYGRPAAYTSANRSRSDSRNVGSTRSSIPAQGSRSNYEPARRSYEQDARSASARARSEADNFNQARSRSRFEEDVPAQESARPQRPAPRASGSTLMFTLKTLTDVNPVIKALIRGDSIIMTLESEDEFMERRILDTLAGAVFALDANFRRPSRTSNTYLLAPKSVNIMSAYDLED